MKRTTSPARRFARALAPVTLAALALAACGSSSSESPSTSILVAPKITVTSVKGDPRSQLFAAIYARVLEDNGYRVSRKDPVELDRAGYLDALAAGEFQVIPDSTGELLSFAYSQPDAPVAPTTVVPDAPASTVAPATTPTADTSGASTTMSAPPRANHRGSGRSCTLRPSSCHVAPSIVTTARPVTTIAPTYSNRRATADIIWP